VAAGHHGDRHRDDRGRPTDRHRDRHRSLHRGAGHRRPRRDGRHRHHRHRHRRRGDHRDGRGQAGHRQDGRATARGPGRPCRAAAGWACPTTTPADRAAAGWAYLTTTGAGWPEGPQGPGRSPDREPPPGAGVRRRPAGPAVQDGSRAQTGAEAGAHGLPGPRDERPAPGAPQLGPAVEAGAAGGRCPTRSPGGWAVPTGGAARAAAQEGREGGASPVGASVAQTGPRPDGRGRGPGPRYLRSPAWAARAWPGPNPRPRAEPVPRWQAPRQGLPRRAARPRRVPGPQVRDPSLRQAWTRPARPCRRTWRPPPCGPEPWPAPARMQQPRPVVQGGSGRRAWRADGPGRPGPLRCQTNAS
jgi:hypothetical protein